MNNENQEKTLEALMDDIDDKLDIYDRIVDEELYEQEELPSEVENAIGEHTSDYNTPAEGLTEFTKYVALSTHHLKEEKARTKTGDISSEAHTRYQRINDKIWCIPPQLECLDNVPQPQPSIGEIILGRETPK